MKPSNNKVSGAIRLVMLFGLLIVVTPPAAYVQTKDPINDSAPSVTDIVTKSDALAVIDPGPGVQPFQTVIGITQLSNTISSADLLTVPAGKRLVIEFINMTAELPPGQRVYMFSINTGGIPFDMLLIQQPAAIDGDA